MGGHSYYSDCGRCGCKNTLYCSVETKPFEYNSADCLNCGFSYYTKISILKKDELRELRNKIKYKTKRLNKKEQNNCKEFDNIYFVKR